MKMNPFVRAFFLPIMLVAGVFTSFGCALVFAPFALVHRIRERKYRTSDLAKARKLREDMLRQIPGYDGDEKTAGGQQA